LRYIYTYHIRLLIIIIERAECLHRQSSEHTFSFITGRENASTLFNLSSHDTQNTYDQGKAGSRDDMGEPLVTAYHCKFMGTVDYIWHVLYEETVFQYLSCMAAW
jgi:mRNA deadenylase 3'-5' endonuclease subunit Ccr4